MQDQITQSILTAAERFSAATGIGLSLIGREALGDTTFFSDLRKGRSCRLDTVGKLSLWLNARWPSEAEWPEGLPRPKAETAA